MNDVRQTGASPPAKASGWVSILNAVTRPITLYGLTLLISESGFFVAVERASPEAAMRMWLINAILLSVFAIIFAILTLVAPAAFMGTEWLRAPLAESLAETVVDGLRGSITGLPTTEDQIGAWTDLVLWVGQTKDHQDRVEHRFRQFMADGIADRAKKIPELRDALNERLRTARNAG